MNQPKPTPADKAKAEELVYGKGSMYGLSCVLEEAIATALAQARENSEAAKLLAEAQKLRGAIDCTGEVPCVRGVLGKLPLTADGYVFGIEAPTVYAWDCSGKVIGAACAAESHQCDECGAEDLFVAAECYSTREAAEKARTDA